METRLQNSISIYDYTEYRKYLKDLIGVHKKTIKSLTVSGLARKSQNISKAYLSLVMNGQRNLSSKSAEAVGKGLGLKPKELFYFESLVKFNQSKSISEKANLIDQIIAIRPPQKRQMLNMTQYSVLENWHCLIIKELIQLKDFQEDAKWISQKLKRHINEGEAKIALKKLIDSGLVERHPSGQLMSSNHSLNTPDDLKSMSIQRYHASCFELSRKILAEEDVSNREFASVNKLLTQSQFALVKEKIKRFRDELSEITDHYQDDPRSVYQINIQFFNLSKKEEI
jgi:uncharacterized protein (TIGR02147 family)